MEVKPSLNSASAAIIMSRLVLCGIFVWAFLAQYMIPMIVSLFLMMAIVFRVLSFKFNKEKLSKINVILRLAFDKVCLITVSACISYKNTVLLLVLLIVTLREVFIVIGNIISVKVKGKIPYGKLNDNLLMFMFFVCAAIFILSKDYFPEITILNIVSFVIIGITAALAIVSFIYLFKVFKTEISEK